MRKTEIHWWQIDFGDGAATAVSDAVRARCISQGSITERFEGEVAEILGAKHVIATSSGSTSILMALIACGVGPGDEVIVPNRTWISTGHAPFLLGAKVVLCDVEPNRPLIDVQQVKELISGKTKAVIPVHMNGRASDIPELKEICDAAGIFVIEDAAQAFGSRVMDQFIGTQGAIGCFSLSVAKIFSSGQGGFAVTNSDELATKLRSVRTHGVEDVFAPAAWPTPGFNFRYTDIQASIARTQLAKVPERVEKLKIIYKLYADGLSNINGIEVIPVNIEQGEVPIYTEVLVQKREKFVRYLSELGIESRRFYPNLDRAHYFEAGREDRYPESKKYGDHGVYLPSGPSQKLDDINWVIDSIIRGKW